jgi:hypothetical protein
VVLRFCFVLRPIAEVAPWVGNGGDSGGEQPKLHWFALTDGGFWIELDQQQLLRYADELVERWRDDGWTNDGPYVEHYVARLWEDLIELLPAALEPVPADLLAFVASDPDAWRQADGAQTAAAARWHRRRRQNMSYLRGGPEIRWWRTINDRGDRMTLRWLHQYDDSIAFAGAAVGERVIPTERFVTAVRELDSALFAAMSRRIAELARDGSPAGMQFDLAALRSEHAVRSGRLARALSKNPETDWPDVRAGAALLLPNVP